MSDALANFNPDAVVIEDLKPLAQNLRRLAHYCDVKERAMRHRETGNIMQAMLDERICESLYAKLPPEWRW